VDLARLQDSFPHFLFCRVLGAYLTVPPRPLSASRHALARAAAKSRRRLLAPKLAAPLQHHAGHLAPKLAAPPSSQPRPSFPAQPRACPSQPPSLPCRHCSPAPVSPHHHNLQRRCDSSRATVPSVFQGHQELSCPSPTSSIVGKTRLFNLDPLNDLDRIAVSDSPLHSGLLP